MNGFTVEPPVLRAAGRDMSAMADTVADARRFVEDWVRVDKSMTGGTWVSNAGTEINNLYVTLTTEYSKEQTEGEFDTAGRNLRGLAADYVGVDQAQRRRYDAKIAQVDVDAPPAPDDSGSGVETDEIERFFEPPSNALGPFQEWQDIWNTVEDIVGLKPLLNPLSRFVENPVTKVAEEFDEGFKDLGKAIQAVDELASYWRRISSEVRQTAGRFPGKWEGNAADAASDWLDETATVCSDHARALGSMRSRIQAEAVYMKASLDLILGVVKDIVDILPSLDGSWDDLMELGGAAAKAVAKAVNLAQHAVRLVRLAVLIGAGIVAIIAQIASSRDVTMDLPKLGDLAVA